MLLLTFWCGRPGAYSFLHQNSKHESLETCLDLGTLAGILEGRVVTLVNV